MSEKKKKAQTAKTGATGVNIICPPDRHIPVEFHEICSLVKAGMSIGERNKFEQVAQLVESLFAQRVMVLKRDLKHNFLRFSLGAKDQPIISRVGGGLPTVAELDVAEVKMVGYFMQLMCAARFHILTVPEWELAKADDFMFSLPVEVNWEYYDAKLLRSFWDSSGERRALRAQLPDMADRVLVFHRGITVAQASGMYTSEKIDLLVDYLVTKPLKKLWRRLRRLPPEEATAQTLSLTSSRHSAVKVVERRTLRLLMPTVWSVIKNFHLKLKLQEPAFKEVVVLYRADTSSKLKSHRLPALQRPVEQRQREILLGRNIHIKAFHDIPMADMDVIFADKKVYLKMLTIIQLIITVVGAVVAAATVLLQGEKVDMNVLWSALSLVAARCGQVYTSAQAERSQTIQDMVNILYDKTDDAQEGVVSMLLEDMAEEQLKEAILTYGRLLIREAAMTSEMLDLDCERFLRTNFDLSIDFAVEDAIPRLVEYGLVKVHYPAGATRPKFEAATLDEAVRNLERAWAQATKQLAHAKAATWALSNLVAGKEPVAPVRPAQQLHAPPGGAADAAAAAAAAALAPTASAASASAAAAAPAAANGGAPPSAASSKKGPGLLSARSKKTSD